MEYVLADIANKNVEPVNIVMKMATATVTKFRRILGSRIRMIC
jgi:hypothetical protein